MLYINRKKNFIAGQKGLKELAPDSYRLIRTKNSKFVGDRKKIVINWGDSTPNDEVLQCRIINNPHHIKYAVNKRKFLTLMEEKGVPAPRIVKYSDEALEQYGYLYCRTLVEGKAGKGIVIIKDKETGNQYRDKLMVTPAFPNVPLQYTTELRVHAGPNTILSVAQKMRRKGHPKKDEDHLIRTHSKGWVFVKNGMTVSDSDKDAAYVVAKAAIKAIGLDFGGVDVVVYNGGAKVLEVNTAPGIEGSVVAAYHNYFKELENEMLYL